MRESGEYARPLLEHLKQSQFEAVDNPEAANFIIPGGEEIEGEWYRKTDDEVLLDLAALVQTRYWFLRPEYIGKTPWEQCRLQIGEHHVDVFNYTDEQLEPLQMDLVANAMAEFEARFPGGLQEVRHVPVINELPKIPYGKPDEFIRHAEAWRQGRMFALLPHALNYHEPYREVLSVPILTAVVTHELAHFGLGEELAKAWARIGLVWHYVETRGGKEIFEAHEPEKCVTPYGEFHPEEDGCDSVVAYMYDREKLSPDKLEAISTYDHMVKSADAPYRVPPYVALQHSDIQMPRLPKLLTYYVDYESSI